MRTFTSLLAIILFILGMPLAAQVSSFDEMEFEADSVKTTYRAAGKNHVFVKSKRGTSGMSKTPEGDAVLTSEVTEIVLVFSELDASAISEREEANRERWENLLATYPELFQFSTTYKNVCQCNINGDAEAFKKTQGFYIYVNGDVPKVEAAVTPAPAAAQPVTKTEKPAETKKSTETPAAIKEPAKAVEKEKPVAVADKTEVKPKEEPPVIKETPKAAEPEAQEEAVAETPKASPKKKPAAATTKPRKAKDPKACRQPCYGYGDDDLIAFFKDNITLTKKQKRKAKNWVANVKIQIHFDGTVKKTMVAGSETAFNQMVEDALKKMNNWNAAVKSGTAVKSEVRFNLKYDKATKAMRPSDFVINPRPSPKCPCMTDSEVFGSD